MAKRLSIGLEVGVIVLTLLGIECVYRLAYWCLLTTYPRADAHLASSHLHFWLAATVLTAFLWIYCVWRVLRHGRTAEEKTKKGKLTAAP